MYLNKRGTMCSICVQEEEQNYIWATCLRVHSHWVVIIICNCDSQLWHIVAIKIFVFVLGVDFLETFQAAHGARLIIRLKSWRCEWDTCKWCNESNTEARLVHVIHLWKLEEVKVPGYYVLLRTTHFVRLLSSLSLSLSLSVSVSLSDCYDRHTNKM